MLTNPSFYIVWAVMAIFPLMIAFLAPETWGYSSCTCYRFWRCDSYV